MNISNSLTCLRIFLIFFFLILASIQCKFPGFYPFIDISSETVLWCHRSAFFIAIIAAVTDFFDGYLARKLNQVTDFGALMDPLADKILIMAVLLVFVEAKLIPAWIAVAIIAREFMVTGLRTLAVKKGVIIPADGWGKIKTVLQMTLLGIGGCAWVHFLPDGVDLVERVSDLNIYRIIWHGALMGLVGITVGSGLAYFIRFKDLYTKDM